MKHKIRNFIGMGVVLVVILAIAGPFIYIHFIEGPAPARLSLPTSISSNTYGSRINGNGNGGERDLEYRYGLNRWLPSQ